MKGCKTARTINLGYRLSLILIMLPFLFVLLEVSTGPGGAWSDLQKVFASDSGKRLVVLGFDGMDYDLVEQYMDEGKLPNFARLRDRGVYSPLYSSTPPESPVAWSTFVTGTNPGKTGVFDFLRRNPETYYPELNMTDVVQAAEFKFDTIPVRQPVMRNARRGPAFWSYSSEAGVKTIGIMMPMNMPPEEAPGSSVFSGLGVPDARKTMGTYVYYVDDLEAAKERTGSREDTEMGGRVIEVTRNGNKIETYLPGPLDPVHPGSSDELRAPVFITVDPSARTAQFEINNRTPFRFIIFFAGAIVGLIIALILWVILARVLKSNSRGFATSLLIFILALAVLYVIARPTTSMDSLTVGEGEWSDWLPVRYLVTDWVGLEGFFKVYLIETEPSFQLYVTPVSIDPRGTMVALSYPGSYARNLLNKYGYFKTYGWDSETWALNENVIDEETYLEDCFENWDIKADMVVDQMKRDDWRLFSAVFQGTDHVQHMFWRTLDPTHPMYTEEMASEYGDAILQIYQRADALVGRTMDEILDKDDELIVMSDHGFNSFRYAVNLNRWLIENGYMAEKPNLLSNLLGGGQMRSVPELFKRQQQFFEWVDWSKTRAYALGLGQIYINLEGRESKGIVPENQRSALIDEIIAELKNLTDPATGQPILVGVYRADQIYHGDNMEYAPDIVVGFTDGYRVSWQTTLGVAAEDLIEPNMRKWSGDHCSFDASVTTGILFSTIPITVGDPNLIDITPSMLNLFGIEKPSYCDGREIFDLSAIE
jgi:predicted AlkP superfamily phosphohydrolase/phosphomutase